jgi:glycosyltransferase involved in cell wall biosynthesis
MNEKVITIGIDCRDLQVAISGTKTYLVEIVKALQENEARGGVRVVLIKPFLPVITGKSFLSKAFKHLQFFCWKQISLPILAMLKTCDVLICTDYFAPCITPGFKNIVVFHDAFFWEYPKHYNRFWLQLFEWFAIPAAKNAAKIIAPTQYAKKQILHYLQVPENHIEVVYEATKAFSQTRSSLTNFNMPSVPYLLHVGVLSKHKNLSRLIDAFAEFLKTAQSPVHLLLVGGKSASIFDDDYQAIQAAITKHQLSNAVTLTGYVNEIHLNDIYKHAVAYVFPSYNEGFGLPMLEAMSYHLPIAAANNTCLEEVGGAGAIYFNPFDTQEITAALHVLLNHKTRIEACLNAQDAVLQQFSWKKAANEIKNICLQSTNKQP